MKESIGDGEEDPNLIKLFDLHLELFKKYSTSPYYKSAYNISREMYSTKLMIKHSSTN